MNKQRLKSVVSRLERKRCFYQRYDFKYKAE
jgi:hypothetical protein